ncbi:FxsA family protein [Helicobacter sp. MIT 05-5294]|uniref:FxsA family protein n=1 Tax=Helicobacter sp. MIT 05-5294 TaxID=1548150 RepID=UPI00051F9E37|nr:FxsA family protein [Helicobacter sp. MIT 05-5294]TLD89082.1 FxsA family protein [Helicobacter sp. MIT 05-5294]
MPLIFGFIYLFLEVLITYEIIDNIGVLGFVLEIILSALFGFFILVNYRYFLGEALMRVKLREISYEAFVSSNVFRILGAILLIMPGGLTDILGILMQFSALGFLLFKPFIKKPPVDSHSPSQTQNDEIIDVEVIENNKQG